MKKQIGIFILFFFLFSCSWEQQNNNVPEWIDELENRIDFSDKKDNLEGLNINCDEYLSLSEEEKKWKLQLYMKCQQLKN